MAFGTWVTVGRDFNKPKDSLEAYQLTWSFGIGSYLNNWERLRHYQIMKKYSGTSLFS